MQPQVFRLSSSNSKCSKAIRRRPGWPKRRLIKAEAKEAYFKALRAEMPELMKIATGRRRRPGAGHLRRGVRCGGRKTGDGCGPRDTGIAKTLLARSRRRE